ncbi:flagellar basal body-associated FliL family protein [Cellulomonas sp. RIT-PI-Y]|jgi:flagellar protein FliL|uniref:flagellar basal body-associated FliL family protein n=1 Tax=Cellulomonas sp. RIT-PI-Y TaxID=3035297 RepID=UPI0021D90D2B|nr:flagellar basal body-associated FliL family protein [Cellulomonas sp. RIT-PI-Y]
MPIEQRVIGGGQKIGGGKIGGTPAKEEPAAEEPKKKSKKLLILILAAVVVIGGAAAYFLVLKPSGGEAAAEPEPTHVAGAVATVDAISVNLADGHYLRLGFALQLTEEVGEEAPDTSKAVDIAIELYSGQTMAQVSDPTSRDALKTEFLHQLEAAYPDEVMDVYLTNYVTQ